VDALDTEQRIRACTPAATGTRHRAIHVRVSFGVGLLRRYQFKEALTSFPPHHAATKTAAEFSDRPNQAHLRRDSLTLVNALFAMEGRQAECTVTCVLR
jgi:hypothetical protein